MLMPVVKKGEQEPSLEMLQRTAGIFMVSVESLLVRTTRSELLLTDNETYIISVNRKTDMRAVRDAVILLEARIKEQK